jgi:RAMA domain-containing protein
METQVRTPNAIFGQPTDLLKTIVDIWSVPTGYKSSTKREPLSFHPVDLSELLSAGLITAGQTIMPRDLKLREHICQVLSDGRIDMDGQLFETPSGAEYHLRKRSTNGWSFWLLDPQTKKSLASVRREYLETSSLESNSIDDDDKSAVPIILPSTAAPGLPVSKKGPAIREIPSGRESRCTRKPPIAPPLR